MAASERRFAGGLFNVRRRTRADDRASIKFCPATSPGPLERSQCDGKAQADPSCFTQQLGFRCPLAFPLGSEWPYWWPGSISPPETTIAARSIEQATLLLRASSAAPMDAPINARMTAYSAALAPDAS